MVLMLSACGPAEPTGQGGTDESTGDTGEPDDALEPACQFKWEWRQRLDATQSFPNWAIDVDEGGNVYAIGQIDEVLVDPEAYASDIWVASWTPDGTQAWARTFGEPFQNDNGW